MDYKLRLKQLISDAINDGYMEFGDANEMFSFIIDSYMDDRDAFDTIQEFFPGIGEVVESSTEPDIESSLNFSSVELSAIEDALEYLLDAELLPENGYTDDVVNALKSALNKVIEANPDPMN